MTPVARIHVRSLARWAGALLLALGALSCAQAAPAAGAASSLPDATSLDLAAATDNPASSEAVGTDTVGAADAPGDALADAVPDAGPVDAQSDGGVASDLTSADSAADAAVETGPPSACAGVTCSGHGTCYPIFGTALCKCDTGFWLLGTQQCLPESQPSPCHPNPCAEPDKNICSLTGNGADAKPVCSCAPGFSETSGLCLFQTCPQLAAHTAVTVYDQTGAGVAEGFDPLQAGDTVKLRIEVEVLSGSGDATVELQSSNLTLDDSRVFFDGKKTKGTQKATIFSVPVALTAGLHALELLGKLDSNLMPLGLNARLVGGTGCEVPQSRSGARIGPLGLLDPKGFGCIDLDRTRSVQVTHDVVEKNTAAYGQANGVSQDYQPAGSIVSAVTQCVYRQTDRALLLAGDGRATLPWAVDNDMIIEVFDHAPAPGDAPTAVLYQGTDQVTSNKGWAMKSGPDPDVPGTHFGIPNGMPFGFSAGHVRLESYVPKFKQTWLKFVALDQGVVGRLTRLYLVSTPAADAPRKCLSNNQCQGNDGQVASGCVQGQCVGQPCGAGCPANQFCVAGFCTSQCNAGGGSCPVGTICAIRSCAAPGTPGLCDPAAQDKDCPPGHVCHWGRCEPGCHHPRKQDQSYAQDPSFCNGNKPALCPHCPSPAQGCWNNVCAECEVDAHCAAGQWCVDRVCMTP